MAKKKVPVDKSAVFKNGMYKERTKQSALQGLLLFVFICLLGVMSYIVSMIPAGIFGVVIAKTATGSQLVYDVQNLINVFIGLAILCIGGMIFAKKAGENDALETFQNKLDRKLDMRYLGLSVVVAVVVYIFVGVILNVDFFIGPVKYLGIFLCRAERSINEGIKVPFGLRFLAMLICMAITAPFLIKGARSGYKEKMTSLEAEEAEAAAKEAERKAAEEAKSVK